MHQISIPERKSLLFQLLPYRYKLVRFGLLLVLSAKSQLIYPSKMFYDQITNEAIPIGYTFNRQAHTHIKRNGIYYRKKAETTVE